MLKRLRLFQNITRITLKPKQYHHKTHLLSRHLISFHNDCTSLQLPFHVKTTKQFYCSNSAYEHSPDSSEKTLGKITPKLFLAFTCKICNTRVEKHISKIAYTKGVVIVRCDKCEENHLIADNLGWFPNLKAMKNIEDIMASKGETVKKTLQDNEETSKI